MCRRRPSRICGSAAGPPVARLEVLVSVPVGKLVSSLKLDDIPAFNRAMLELFSHARESAHAT